MRKRTRPEQRNLVRRPIAVAVAGSLFAALGVSAEPRDQGTIETIEVVGQRQLPGVASVKFTRSLLDTAQTIDVVPESLIDERAATTLRGPWP